MNTNSMTPERTTSTARQLSDWKREKRLAIKNRDPGALALAETAIKRLTAE